MWRQQRCSSRVCLSRDRHQRYDGLFRYHRLLLHAPTARSLEVFFGLSPALAFLGCPSSFFSRFLLIAKQGRELMTKTHFARSPGRYANLVGTSFVGYARERAHDRKNEIARTSFSLSADVCMYWYHRSRSSGLIRRAICQWSRTLRHAIMQRRDGALCCLPETPGDRKLSAVQ